MNAIWIETEEGIEARVYKHFVKRFSRADLLEDLGEFTITDGVLRIDKLTEERSERKVQQFLRKYKQHLTYRLNGNPAIYVDEDLGLPLIGLNFLGILDKGSEILEIKPITNCNANCSFCSVNEGPDSDKEIDFVIDNDYLVAETKSLIDFKQAPMSLWINPHGEPTLWAPLAEYCDDMLAEEHVKDIHIITNGILLTKGMVDALDSAAKKHGKMIALSVSMSGLGKEPQEKTKLNKEGLSTSQITMGKNYNVDVVMRHVRYAVTKLPITITPVLVEGMNNDEMDKLIVFLKELKELGEAEIMIQKFCINKMGRNPIKEKDWESFFATLKTLEKTYELDLTKPLGKILETKQLHTPLERRDKVKVRILCPSRYARDKLGVITTEEGVRAVTVIRCPAQKGEYNGTVVQNKYNVVVCT